MKKVVEVLVPLLSASLLHSLASPPFIKASREEALWKARGVLDFLLKESSVQRSLILVTDGATTSSSIYQVLGPRGQGTEGTPLVMMEVDGKSDKNLTQSLVAVAVVRARQARILLLSMMVVVVSDDPSFLAAFAEASDRGRLMVWATRLLVITRLAMPCLHGLMKHYWTFAMMNTMFLNLKESSTANSWQILVHLPYTPSGAQVVRVARFMSSRSLVFSADRTFFPEKYNNFHGMQFNLTWLPLTPYWMEIHKQTPDGKQVSTYKGREYLIMQAMGAALNFSLNPLPFEGWDRVLRRLREREAFVWPVTLPIMLHMLEEYDISLFIERSTLGFSMAKPSLEPSWQSLYYPLRIEVWISIAVTVLMEFMVLLMMNHCQDGEDPGTWVVVKQVAGTLLDEAIPGELPRKSSTRIVLAAWLVFAFIVGTVYRGNLTASLTVPKYPPRAETFAELLNTGAKVTVVVEMEIFYTSFKKSESRILRTLSERMKYVPSFKEGMQDALTQNSAHLYERLYMEVMIEEYFTNDDGSTSLYVTRESLLDDYTAFILVRDAPFKPTIDNCLMAFHEGGLIAKWKTDVMDEIRREKRERRNKKKTEVGTKTVFSYNKIKSLTIIHMQGPFLLYLVSTTISLAVFVSEVFSVYLCHPLD